MTDAKTEDGQNPARNLGQVDDSFYLIGIGASAGGLDAIKQVISQVPENFPHSFVIVQHISPDYKSLMAEILGRSTTLPLCEVTDNMPVERGCIYLIPPRSNIVIQGTRGDSSPRLEDGVEEMQGNKGLRFSLVEPSPRPALNLPIDIFFISLAEAVGGRGISIVLSGTGSDGSRGIRAVKSNDGFVLVQEPKTAGFDGMPRTAIATGMVDMVLSPDDMIEEITRYIEMRDKGIIDVGEMFSKDTATYKKIVALVSEQSEIDFTRYKEPTLKRRIARRLALKGHDSPEAYLAELRDDTAEVNVLSREFLVGVTNFFRDLPVWQAFQEKILEDMFASGNTDQPLRIWSVGCSTGEEAYSAAMMLEDYRAANGISRDFRVYATDVNEAAIAVAKQGVYPEETSEEIPDDLLQKGYVEFRSGVFRIVPAIRNRVVFAVHNVAEDPPYTQTDLIICRNLLIYLSPDVQAKVITHFSFSLRKDAILMLGAAESPGQHGAMFQPLIGKLRIFRNRRVAENRRGKEQANYALTTSVPMPRVRRLSYRDQTPEDDLQRLLTGMLESNGAVICVVDENARMIKTFGDVSPVLHFPTGGFSAHLLDLIDERLRSPVMLAIRRAEAEGVSERRDLRMTLSDQQSQTVNLVARKITWQAHTVAYAVQFNIRTEELPKHPLAGVDSSGMPRDAYVAHLESEVRSLQDMLSATAEDLGASNEELQTTNEELTAANEELQANNEETQSINEELHTVNAEHAERISDLEAATADIENLLATADVGIVVLSNSLRVRRYSAGLAPFMDLGPRDVDRPLDNVTTTLTPDSMTLLADDARIALETKEESGRELRRKDGGWVRVRTRPFYGPDETPRGVVCSMQDVTSLKLLELEVTDQRERIETMLESEVEGVFDWQSAPGPSYLSPRFRAMLGYGETEVPDRLDAWLDLVHPDDLAAARAALETHLMSRNRETPLNIDLRCRRRDGSYADVQVRGRGMEWSDRARPARVVGVIADISQLRAREESVKRQDEAARRFVRVATLEWNALLGALRQVTDTLDETKQDVAFQRLNRLSGLMQRRMQSTLDFWDVEPGDLTIESQDLTALAHAAAGALRTEIMGTELKFEIGDLPAIKGSRALLTEMFETLLRIALEVRKTAKPSTIRLSQIEDTANEGAVVIQMLCPAPDVTPESVGAPGLATGSASDSSASDYGLEFCKRVAALHGGVLSVSYPDPADMVVTISLNADHAP
ncbi:chemotaxis protein CheB [Sagittula stellata]|uniref:protein-glutamate O-methyltransferase n=1 Tax=Sagittula stellata (strain ATCC 700073 / DSM 11524 / E-37) TaxID=388399 RepID=A3K0U6_SAGS3|nr:chemotaxis protein CheB [Sagittula stellata]EBA09411.1 hypothetical protein SSE37_24254 [Sagittula stellata E-37]